jgi:hypothetical protein
MTNSYQDLSLVEAIEPDEDFSLMDAVREEEVEMVKRLLEAGWDPNEPEEYYLQSTPLCTAVTLRCIEVVQLLLMYGGEPNLPRKWGYTPLYYAIETNEGYDSAIEIKDKQLNIIKLMLANRGDLNWVADKKSLIKLAGPIEMAVIKEQLIQNAIYAQLMSNLSAVPFKERGENGQFASVLWALLYREPTMEVLCHSKSDIQNIQMENVSVILPTLPEELWIRIFSFVLEASLKEKSLALLHIFPYKDRQVNVIQSALNWLLGNKVKSEFPSAKQVRDNAIAEADSQLRNGRFTLSP